MHEGHYLGMGVPKERGAGQAAMGIFEVQGSHMLYALKHRSLSHDTVAASTSEAEYMAAAYAIKEAFFWGGGVGGGRAITLA
jgi:hypothetical protein